MKRPFDLDIAFERIAKAVADYPKAALFELAEDGHDSAFEQLIACMISIRTRDEVTLPTARRFFAAAPTPSDVSRLSIAKIDELIRTSSFHEAKAAQIHAIAQQVVNEHNGVLPCDLEVLLSLRGVGPKCANLVLGIAGGRPYIGVDIHVHRITNRWSRCHTKTPEQTLKCLEEWLPQKYWIEINRLLVPFGKHICTGRLPKCSTCPVLDMCEQIGVEKHR